MEPSRPATPHPDTKQQRGGGAVVLYHKNLHSAIGEAKIQKEIYHAFSSR
jgi:hypothetical protein